MEVRRAVGPTLLWVRDLMNPSLASTRKEVASEPLESPPQRLFSCRRGAGAVEFALTIPVLLLIVAGIAELGRVIYTGDALANAVRETARAAIVRGSASDNPISASELQSLLRARAATLSPGNVAVTVTYEPNNNPGSVVTIRAQYPIAFVMPPFSSFGPITLSRTASLVIAN